MEYMEMEELEDGLEKELERERERWRESKEREIYHESLPLFKCCIFKIPSEVSKHNEEAYSPIAFSIGPFHYQNPRTKPTHTIKLRYLDDLLTRHSHNASPLKLKDLIEAIDRYYSHFYRHYGRAIDHLNPNEFTQILVLDGCFIIELFLKKYLQKNIENDLIFSQPRMRQHLNHDLVLLENQIPWLVLRTLYHEMDIPEAKNNGMSLNSLTLNFFSPIYFSNTLPSIPTIGEPGYKSSKLHILDLLRTSLLCNMTNEPMNSPNDGLKPVMLSATTLDENGIKIQPENMGSILNVRFKDGVLTIPQLKVNDTTEALFRNLVSLEHYCYNSDGVFDGVVTSYVKLFDDLVQTVADMKMLCEKKVVHNMLRLEKATQIFNQTSNYQLDVKDNYYFELIREIDKYHRNKRGYYMSRWRVHRRDLKNTYFTHPWAVISTIAASFVIICTFLQTLFTIMSYK